MDKIAAHSLPENAVKIKSLATSAIYDNEHSALVFKITNNALGAYLYLL
jgi:hypothetical protein